MTVHPDQNPQLLRHPDGVLPPDEVHIWHTELTVPENGIDSLLELLEPEERDRALRFKVSHAYHQFVISRAFVRKILALYLRSGPREVRFRTTAHGKPELAGARDVRFNLSHTAGAAVMAIVRGRQVGVDVERVREDVNTIELADRFFSAPEAEWVRSQTASDRSSSFFACWTAKEAYVKAHGEGLSMPLSAFSVIPRRSAPGTHWGGTHWERLQLEVFGNAEESRRWSIWQLDLASDLRAALAVEGQNCEVRLGHWPSVGGG